MISQSHTHSQFHPEIFGYELCIQFQMFINKYYTRLLQLKEPFSAHLRQPKTDKCIALSGLDQTTE